MPTTGVGSGGAPASTGPGTSRLGVGATAARTDFDANRKTLRRLQDSLDANAAEIAALKARGTGSGYSGQVFVIGVVGGSSGTSSTSTAMPVGPTTGPTDPTPPPTLTPTTTPIALPGGMNLWVTVDCSAGDASVMLPARSSNYNALTHVAYTVNVVVVATAANGTGGNYGVTITGTSGDSVIVMGSNYASTGFKMDLANEQLIAVAGPTAYNTIVNNSGIMGT